MTNAARRLGLFALAILLLGLIGSGLWMHAADTPRLVKREEVGAVLLAADGTRSDGVAAATRHVRINVQHSRIVQAHAHFLNLCVLVLLVALLLNCSSMTAARQLTLGGLLCSGTVIYPLGLVVDGMWHDTLGHVLAFAGAICILLVAALIVIDRLRGHRPTGHVAQRR